MAKPNGLFPSVMIFEKWPSGHSPRTPITKVYRRSGWQDEDSQIAIPAPADQCWQGMAGLGQARPTLVAPLVSPLMAVAPGWIAERVERRCRRDRPMLLSEVSCPLAATRSWPYTGSLVAAGGQFLMATNSSGQRGPPARASKGLGQRSGSARAWGSASAGVETVGGAAVGFAFG